MRLTFVILLVAACAGCNVFTDLESLRSDGSAGEACMIENPCEGCTERNACGGCDALPGQPGEMCGTCDSGVYECDGEALACSDDAGDNARNVCGGCGVLEGALDDPCGVCMSGRLRCDRQEALICEGEREDARNECGGCADLMGAVGDSCGTCDSGQLGCNSDGNELVCEDGQGQGAQNACGGCDVLDGAPGDPCNMGCGQLTCVETELVCEGEEGRVWYRDSDDDMFGDPQSPSEPSCEQPDGYVDNRGDCNDRDPLVNPGETEQADDTIDNDCDGLLLHRPEFFTQGSPEVEVGRETDEAQRTVTLSRNIAAGRHEVSQALWAEHVPDTPGVSGCEEGNCPVACVNVYESMYFLNAWSEAAGLEACYTLDDCVGNPGTGQCNDNEDQCEDGFQCTGYTFSGPDCAGYRLPTEAEWEFLARAGTSTAHYRGELSEFGGCNDLNLDAMAWYCGTAGDRPHAVGQKASNPFGLQDVLGNVGEWTQDTYDIWEDPTATDPLSEGGDAQVWRGGTYSDQTNYLRSASREILEPACRTRDIGFRAVRTIP